MSISAIPNAGENTNHSLQNYITVGDVDAASASLRMTLTVSSGVLMVTTGTGISSISGSGTGSVVLVGTLSGLQTKLAQNGGVTYRGNTSFSGNDTLAVTLNDQGNTGSGGHKTASASRTFTVIAANIAPTVSISTIVAVNEDTNLSLQNYITVNDVDAASGSLMVTMTVSSGVITVTTGTGISSISGSGTDSVVIVGTLSGLQTLFTTANRVTYRGNLNFNGTDTLMVTINDQGNTGSGGHKTASASRSIPFNAVNDAPTVSIGTIAAVDEDTNLSLQNSITVGDVDAASASLRMTLTVSSGVLTVTTGTGISSITGSGTGSVVLVGTLSGLQTKFGQSGGVTYRGNLNASGSYTLTVTANDRGNTGSGGHKTGSANRIITVDAVNDAPTVSTIAISAATEDTPFLLPSGRISIADVDVSASDDIVVTMTVSSGVLTVTTGTDISGISGSGTASVIITGTLGSLQIAFAQSNRITYLGNTNFTGTETLGVTINDLGNTGSGGHKTASANRTFTVNAVNDAPTVSIATIPTAQSSINFTLQNYGTVGDIDAGSGNLVVTMTVSSGVLTVTNVSGGVNPATAGSVRNNGTATVVMTGTLTALQTTFAGTGALTYRSTLNVNGNDTLVITVNDRGNTGSGGHKTATASQSIPVNAVNDAPTVSISGPFTATEDITHSLQNAVSVGDIDASSGSLRITMTVSSGVLTVTNVSGGVNPATAGSVRNNGTATVVMTGTLTALQTTFAGTGASHLSRQSQLQRHGHARGHHQRPRQYGQRRTQDRHRQCNYHRQSSQRYTAIESTGEFTLACDQHTHESGPLGVGDGCGQCNLRHGLVDGDLRCACAARCAGLSLHQRDWRNYAYRRKCILC